LISGVVFHGSPWGVEMPLIITGSGSISYDRRVTWYAVLHVPCEPFRVRDIQMILAVLGEEVGRSRISFFLRDSTGWTPRQSELEISYRARRLMGNGG